MTAVGTKPVDTVKEVLALGTTAVAKRRQPNPRLTIMKPLTTGSQPTSFYPEHCIPPSTAKSQGVLEGTNTV